MQSIWRFSWSLVVVTWVALGSVTGAVAQGPAPVVSQTPYNADHQAMARCAVACFAATYAHTTPGYVSMDVLRNATLVYHGDRLNPKPFVHMDVKHGGTTGDLPQQFQLAAKLEGATVTFLNGETLLRFAAPTNLNWYRLAGQFDAAANGATTTGAYDLQILVTAQYGGGPVTTTVNTKLLVVDEDVSSIAKGWTIAGIQRLYPDGDSAMITEGEGSAVFFKRSGSTFTRPAGEFSTLVLNQPNGSAGWTRKYADSTKVVFNSSGRMIEIRDRFSNTTTIVYDGSNRVQDIQDPTHTVSFNRRLRFTYGTNGLSSIASFTDTYTKTLATVTVNASKQLTQIKDPDNLATNLGYDGSDRIITITDRRGKTTTLAYDPFSGKLATVTAAAVPIFGAGTVSPVITMVAWQKSGVPYTFTATTPAPLVSNTSVLASVADPGGHQTTFTVNKWGQPLTLTEPLSQVTAVTYTTNGQPAKVVHPTGATDTVAYNSDGLATYVKPAGGVATSIRYPTNKWALPDSIWGTNQPTRIFSLSGGSITSATIVGAGGGPSYTTTFTYVSDGRLNELRDPSNHLLHKNWYVGRYANRSKDSVSAGAVTTYSHDVFTGMIYSVTRTHQPTRRWTFDAMNRVTKDSVVGYPATSYAYEDSLHLTKVTDPKAQVYRFVYNAVGWPIAEFDPVNRADSLFYSLDGEVRRWKNRRNQAITYTYDVLHRPLATNATGVADTLSYPDPTGRIVRAANALSTVTQYFNVRGQPDSVVTVLNGRTYKQRYAYMSNSPGLLDSTWATASSGSATFLRRQYKYNTARGTLDSLRLALQGWTRLTYDGELLPTQTKLANNDVITRTFSSRDHRVATSSSTAGHNPTTGFTAVYDSLARLRWKESGDEIKWDSYRYDGRSRLAADSFVTYTPAGCLDPDDLFTCWPDSWDTDSVRTYAYDQVGNRTDHGGAYNTGNRITSFEGCTYSTDNDGNVRRRTCGSVVDSMFWGPTNRLDSLKVGSAMTRLGYDALGRLVRKDKNGTVRYFVWDGANLLAEVDAAGAEIGEYSYYPGLDNLHAFVVGSTAYNPHYNAAGNVIGLTNGSKVLKRSYGYESFGKLAGGSDLQPFNGADRARFKGALYLGEEAGLYYMRNRWYEPHAGRFLSEDPIGLVEGINQYVFAADDPLNYADPLGLSEEGPKIGAIEGTNDDEDCVGLAPNAPAGDDGSYSPKCVGGTPITNLRPPADPRAYPNVPGFDDPGNEAERACARAAFFAPAIIAADVVGARATWHLLKSGFRFGASYLKRGLVRGGLRGASPEGGLVLTHDVAGARTATRAAAFAALPAGAEGVQLAGSLAGGLAPASLGEFALGLIPYYSTAKTLEGLYEKCLNPGG